MSTAIDDPRHWPDAGAAPPPAAALHRLAAASLGAATARDSDRLDAEIDATLQALLESGDGERLATVFASAPDAASFRHLWRALVRAEARGSGDGLRATLFALPVVIVAAASGERDGKVTLPGVLPDPAALVAQLRAARALGANETFTLGNALFGADALDLRRLPAVLGWRQVEAAPLPDLGRGFPPLACEVGAQEAAHLRFIAGAALAAPGVDVIGGAHAKAFGLPLAQALARALAAPGASVLALPRPPLPLAAAVAQGRQAQREVSAQLFAASAIRKLRGSVGEPSAVISAHRALDAPCGGELRLSLSSPFEPREAEGFRCPLYALDRPTDVASMLVDLLRDCRVDDVRVLPGVHPDRDPATGLTLLFKADTLPPEGPAVH